MKYPVPPVSPSGAQWEAVCSWDLLIDSLTMSTQPTVSVHAAQDILFMYSYVTERALQQSGGDELNRRVLLVPRSSS